MKFLTFVDTHQDRKALRKLVQRAKEADIDFLICAGDLSDFCRGLRESLEELQALGKTIYFIPGNHEEHIQSWNELTSTYSNFQVFHRQALIIEDYVFLGYGGSGFVQEDADFRKLARSWYDEHQDKKIVFVTHGPPFGTEIDWINQRHVGNRDFRSFIERIKPQIAICGHVHETAGKVVKIKDTQLINPGSVGMVIELK